MGSSDAKFEDLMKAIKEEEGIKVAQQVLLSETKEFRMPAGEPAKLVVFDGEQRIVCDDAKLEDYGIDGSQPLVCGELQDEWLENVQWGAFGHTVSQADHLNHRELIIFNADK